MKYNIISAFSVLLSLIMLGSCNETTPAERDYDESGRARMKFTFEHPSLSRATDTAFEEGDKVGIFVNPTNESLQIAGNTVNNEKFTFGANGNWTAERNLFWDNGNYNIFAYYPRLDSIPSVLDLPFSVKSDQRAETGKISGMSASDFLFASKKNVAASTETVKLQFKHILSKISIQLIKGDDYEGELPETATVYIHNTVPQAVIDLEAGVATKYNYGKIQTITAHQDNATKYSAIIVPQRLQNRVPLIEVEMKGVSYLFESKFLFKAGIQHNVNLVINKNPEQLKIEIGGEIVNWN